MIDYVFAQIPDLELIGFGIGNEIDAYLANNHSRWRQYQKILRKPPADSAAVDPGAVRIGFSEQKDLFHCPAGSFVSLDHDSPHVEVISMRWNHRYGDDWMWCLKNVNRRKLANAAIVSFWLKSDREGPIFLRIDESDGESFFVMANSGTDWKKFEFNLDDFLRDAPKRLAVPLSFPA